MDHSSIQSSKRTSLAALFRRSFDALKAAGLFIGNIVSTVFLVVFYYTVFALFALPRWLISGTVITWEQTLYSTPRKQYRALEDFKSEF